MISPLRHRKNKFILGAYFSYPFFWPPGSIPFSKKHPYLPTYGRYWKIFQLKFVAWSTRNILSYMQNVTQTTPLPPISQNTCQNTLQIDYLYFTSKLANIWPYSIESKLFKIANKIYICTWNLAILSPYSHFNPPPSSHPYHKDGGVVASAFQTRSVNW